MVVALNEPAQSLDDSAAANQDSAVETAVRDGPRPGAVVIRRHLRRARKQLQAAYEALRADPGDAAAVVSAARIHCGLGEFIRAAEILEARRVQGGVLKSFHRDAGQLYLAMGLFRRAERWLSRAIEAQRRPDPEMVELHEKAVEGVAADAARGLGPEAKRVFLEGLERLVRRRPQLVVEPLTELANAHPRLAHAWLALRGAHHALGETEAAETLGETWRRAAPGFEDTIATAMAVRLSPRGLAFDPLEPVVVRPPGESFLEVDDPRALQAGGDRILYLDRGGGTMTLEPLIPLAAAGPQPSRFTYNVAPKFVAALEGAALVGRGLVLNRERQMPMEVWTPCHPAKAGFWRAREGLVCDPAAFRNGVYPVQVFDTPALLMTAPTDGGFGDWMLNMPPRLVLAEAAGLDCPIVVRQRVPGRFIDLLVDLGWNRDRILFHDSHGVSIFPRLYTTSWPLLGRDEPMRDLFDVYRRSPGRRAAGPGERLYLSREGVRGRKLANEPEIRAAFERRGFRTVRPETFGLQEVKDLFAGADLIAGPYGSAFLNVVFAPRPPSALVIMPPTRKGFLDEVAFWVGGSGGRLAYLSGEGEPDVGAWTMPADRAEAALDEFLAATGHA